MLRREDTERLRTERQAVRKFLRDASARELTILRTDAYPIEHVVFPTVLSRLRITCCWLMTTLAGLAPICPAKRLLYRCAGVKVGRGVCISPGVLIDPLMPWLIELEDDCCLGIGCRILAHEYSVENFRLGRTRIGRGSVVGICAIVRAGVSIGQRATVGANSFVNRDVPDGETVGGVPAKPLQRRGAN